MGTRLESIEELRAFAQIVESGSIAAAARVLRLSALTVGRRLQALEDRLGRRLLNRSTRHQSLSDAGRAFLERAVRILDEVEATETFLDAERDEVSGSVAVGVVSALARDALQAIGPLLVVGPELRVQLRVIDQHVNPVSLGLDVVLMGGRPPDSALVARRLISVSPVLAAHERYLERHGVPQTLEDLREHEAVLFVSDPPQSAFHLQSPDGRMIRAPVRGRLEVDASTTMADALVQGLGIGLITRRFVSATSGMYVVLPGYGLETSSLYAVFPHGGARSSRLEVVVEAIRAHVRAQQTWLPPDA